MKAQEVRNGIDYEKYDAQEFRKAMLKGTDAGWKTYNRNMKKAKEAMEKAYDAEIKATIYGTAR